LKLGEVVALAVWTKNK